ncbi:MAG: hypothetical protein M3Q81_04730 [bacterium]|nr:hypothetical protein [bacterium]
MTEVLSVSERHSFLTTVGEQYPVPSRHQVDISDLINAQRQPVMAAAGLTNYKSTVTLTYYQGSKGRAVQVLQRLPGESRGLLLSFDFDGPRTIFNDRFVSLAKWLPLSPQHLLDVIKQQAPQGL